MLVVCFSAAVSTVWKIIVWVNPISTLRSRDIIVVITLSITTKNLLFPLTKRSQYSKVNESSRSQKPKLFAINWPQSPCPHRFVTSCYFKLTHALLIFHLFFQGIIALGQRIKGDITPASLVTRRQPMSPDFTSRQPFCKSLSDVSFKGQRSFEKGLGCQSFVVF